MGIMGEPGINYDFGSLVPGKKSLAKGKKK